MRFSQLLAGAEILGQPSLGSDPEVFGLHYDSRKLGKGFCFVAIKGESTDGNLYIEKALAAGATAVVSDSRPEVLAAKVAWAKVAPGNGRRALAALSGNFCGHPVEKLKLSGVTGTNGKTTTTFLLEAMLAAAQRKAALLGTIEYRIGAQVVPAPHTTPESLELNQFFAQAVAAGATEAVMEVSSHALHQERVWQAPFDVAVFTNLTRDHLDYHQEMESYFAAKQLLFRGQGTPPPRVAVINTDDEFGRRLADFSRAQGSQVVTYGRDAADFHARDISIAAAGTRFTMVTPAGEVAIASPLAGVVNVYNILAASAAAIARGCTLPQIAEAVARLAAVPGRFQQVSAGQPFTVVVDYAHTDDALRNLTTVARDFVRQAATGGRVITVFGCGGDRDRTKRPKMAAAAAQGSDFVVLTSDNPRSENPLAILHDAVAGFVAGKTDFTIEPDRARAIRLALGLAKPGDIVLIAGKGHEKVQIIADQHLRFDDVEVVRSLLEQMAAARLSPRVRGRAQ